MEESEQRRERLKAMRLEANQVTVSTDSGNPLGVSPSLTNPLTESSASQSTQADSYAAPRFDYYTDPMAAFSANKRRSKVSHQVPQDYYTPPRPRNDMTPTPAYQANTYSPDQRMFQGQGVYHNPSPLGSPMQKASPFGTQQVNPPGVFSGSNTYSPDQRMFQAQGVYHSSSPGGSSMQAASPFGAPRVNCPDVFSGSSGPSSYCFPSNLSRGGNFPGPSYAQRGGSPSFNYGQGRGQRFNNSPSPGSGRGGSPYPNSGRGRSHWLGNSFSPVSNQSGRGRLGSHNSEVRPDRLYDRSMVENPWDLLKPVIWRRQNVFHQNMDTPRSLKSWLPNSISMKKARVAEDSKKPTSEPSLAEYLAASFSEAVDNVATNN